MSRLNFGLSQKKGEELWISHVCQTVYDSNGVNIGQRGSNRDITYQKQMELTILQRENYLVALNQAKKVLLNPKSENTFQQFVNLLGSVSNASRTYIFINQAKKNGEPLMSRKAEYSSQGIKPEIDNPAFQNLGNGDLFQRWYNTLSSGEMIFGKVRDFPTDERESLTLLEIKAILIIPIIFEEELLGFIGFDNCASEREWDITERCFLKASANDLAGFIIRDKTRELLKAECACYQKTMDIIDAGADMQDAKDSSQSLLEAAQEKETLSPHKE